MKNKGFTLVELIVVVVILAIVASVASISVTAAVRAYRNKTILKNTADALNSDRYRAFTTVNGNLVSKLIKDSKSKVYHIKTYDGDEEIDDVKVGNSKNRLYFIIARIKDDGTYEKVGENGKVLIKELDFTFDKANGQIRKLVLNPGSDEVELNTNIYVDAGDVDSTDEQDVDYMIFVSGRESDERLHLALVTGRVVYEASY